MVDPGDQITWCNSSLPLMPSLSTSSNCHVYKGVRAQPHTPERQGIVHMCTISSTEVENCWVFRVLTKLRETRFARPIKLCRLKSQAWFIQTYNDPHDVELILWVIWSFYLIFLSICLLLPYLLQDAGSLNQTPDYHFSKYAVFLLSQYLSPTKAYWLCQIIRCSHNLVFCICILSSLDNANWPSNIGCIFLLLVFQRWGVPDFMLSSSVYFKYFLLFKELFLIDFSELACYRCPAPILLE